jgi:tryptophan synthase beta chain
MKKEKSKIQYGGAYVPEMLMGSLNELEQAFTKAMKDVSFKREFNDLLAHFSGRPTPLIYAKNISKKLGGAKLYLKNEGQNLTGAHKITHCLGQALLAKRLGKTHLIAETGAGQHGVATATVAAKLGFRCTIFMGKEDMLRQRPNVFWMEQLGAKVIPVTYGSQTLKDAVNEALKYWMQNLSNTHYCIGSVLGPHPYPLINKTFQSVIGKEVRKQIKKAEGRLPDTIFACVGGGSNAMGIFSDFISESTVSLVAVEAGGIGKGVGEHASRAQSGQMGIMQGYKSLFLQDKEGQIAPTHSIAAGLDYPGLGPELARLKEEGRVKFESATDVEAIEAVKFLARNEGVIPALESAHAVAACLKILPKLPKNKIVVVNLSGRGDKDLFITAKAMNDRSFKEFLLGEYKRYE